MNRTGWSALVLCAALALGCKGEDGATGATGASGADGQAALVNTAVEAAGTNCPAGGVRVDAGIDADADDVLDPTEVTSTQYVCDGAGGAEGAPGAAALVDLTPEAAGENCAYGGTRIDAGLDVDADDLLDPTEVSSTQYVCTPDVSDPAVVSVDPAPGEISSDGTFVVTFSEAMDPATIGEASVYLVYQWDYDGFLVDAELVPATVTYDDATSTATLVSTEPLEIGSPYALHVTGRARDLDGNALGSELVANYWVETDGAAPRVMYVSPTDGEVVGTGPSIAISFDEGLNSASGNLARIALVDGLGVPVPGSSWWDGWSGVYFSPDVSLEEGETYTASIDAIVADWEGNWSRLTMDWSFSVDSTTVPAISGPPVVSPASQIAGGQVEITVPVNAAARSAAVYVGDDWSGWYTQIASLEGNRNGEGTISGTVSLPVDLPPGSHSVWAYVMNGTGAASYWVAWYASETNYTTFDSSDGNARDSGIPLAFLEVGEPVFVDLSATVDFVPGAAGAGTVNFTIRNSGTGAAGPFVAGIFLNPGSVPQEYQVPDRWLDYQGLAAGAEITGSLPVSGLPETVTRAYAYVDLTASVSEPNEDDNLATDAHRWVAGSAYANTTPVPLADYAWNDSPLAVSGGPGAILDATVTLNVTHTRVADLLVYLVSSAGTWVNLVAYRGDAGADFTGTVLDDAAATGIWTGTAPFTGTFRPEAPLGMLAGQVADGTWTLSVWDGSGGEVGTIDSWTLTLW